MKCPYCLSEIEDEALVCKVCTKDLYLFKPLMAQVADLEGKLKNQPDVSELDARIAQLEEQLQEAHARLTAPRPGILGVANSLLLCIVLPLGLLLAAHALITIALDAPLIYLRLLSIVIPLPFGVLLFSRKNRTVLPWFGATMFMALASVIGMSWITSLVDHTAVLPQNAFEWREFLEYAASISFSFLTGMLIGGLFLAHVRHHASGTRNSQKTELKGWIPKIINLLAEGKLDPRQIVKMVEKFEDYGRSLGALGSTALSIYTGLKVFLGN